MKTETNVFAWLSVDNARKVVCVFKFWLSSLKNMRAFEEELEALNIAAIVYIASISNQTLL